MKRLESINLNAAKRALRARDAARDLGQLKLRGGPAEEVQDAEQMLGLLKRRRRSGGGGWHPRKGGSGV